MRTWMALGAALLFAGTARAATTDPDTSASGQAARPDEGSNGAVNTGKSAVGGTAGAAKSELKRGASDVESRTSSWGEGMGELSSGPVSNSLWIDAAGLFDGNGINAQFSHVWSPKISGLLGANYTRAEAISGSITELGAEAGVDYFIIGQNNEGLRIGPRGTAMIGWDGTGSSAGIGNVAVGGELGYNYVATSGLTAGAAAGLDFRLGARLGGNSTGQADLHPYGKLNVGYSW